jgi:hypothetical protein
MRRRIAVPLQAIVSAAAAGTTVLGTIVGLSKYDAFVIDALLIGATGGTLDLYLQRLVDPTNNVWLDWARYTQLASGAAAITYTLGFEPDSLVAAVTHVAQWGAVPSGSPVIAAGSVVACHPGDQLRVVGVAGAGTSAGASLGFYVTGYDRFA